MGLKKGQKHSGSFKKGRSGNPSGRPKEDVNIGEFKRARRQSYLELHNIFRKIGNYTQEEYIEAVQNTSGKSIFEIKALQLFANRSRPAFEFIFKVLYGDLEGRAVLEQDSTDFFWAYKEVQDECKQNGEEFDVTWHGLWMFILKRPEQAMQNERWLRMLQRIFQSQNAGNTYK